MEPEPPFEWQRLSVRGKGPGPRSRHCFAYDWGSKSSVLYGGIVWSPNAILQWDTWELRNGDWQPNRKTRSPGARHRGAMAYDAWRGYCVMFGGQSAWGTILGDTWIYENHRWRRHRIWFGRSPSARCGHSMTFDESSGQIVLFGGIAPSGESLADTWVYDGTWRKIDGPGPGARRYASLTYDPEKKHCILHGGSADDEGNYGFGDTWQFRDRGWKRLPESFMTDHRDDHGLAFHRTAKRVVMLDGKNGKRGLLVLSRDSWQKVEMEQLHPRHQCSPLVWDDSLKGLIFYGGETGHQGQQFDGTWLLTTAEPLDPNTPENPHRRN